MNAVWHRDVPAFRGDSRRSIHEQRFPIEPPFAASKAAACAVRAAAFAFLLGAPFAAHAQPCAPVSGDLLVVADPGAAGIRPRECSTVKQNPPDFGWPYVGAGPYTVSLTLPDDTTLLTMAGQRLSALTTLRNQVNFNLPEQLPLSGQQGDGSGNYNSYSTKALWSLMAYVYTRTDTYQQDAKRRVLNLASWDPRGPTAIDDQESINVAWVVALGCDWLGPVLTQAEK